MLWVDLVFFAGGLVLLVAGAELLVRGASRLAASFQVSPLAVGLTVVAFGTSAPELVVSSIAAVQGNGAVAVGNVAGSNVFNVLVVLGAVAVIRPIGVHTRVVRQEVPLVAAVGVGVWLLALGGRIGRVEGAVLILGLLVYTMLAFKTASREMRGGALQETGGSVAAGDPGELVMPRFATKRDESWGRRLVLGLFVVVGFALLVGGGRFTIDGALGLAENFGLSQRFVALTLVAAGTSLPELATSLVAVLRRHNDLAVGNVLGSNLFNLLGILGVASLIRPLQVPVEMVRVDLPVAVLVPLVALPLLWTGHRIDRWEGGVFLVLYAAYLGWLVVG